LTPGKGTNLCPQYRRGGFPYPPVPFREHMECSSTVHGLRIQKRREQRRVKLAEKLKIIFSYGADLLRGKQIMNPDRFFTVCRGHLFNYFL
jgi:hypothetical protein